MFLQWTETGSSLRDVGLSDQTGRVLVFGRLRVEAASLLLQLYYNLEHVRLENERRRAELEEEMEV